MRTTERLRGLKAWVYEELCKGREMKAPAENANIGEVRRQEPQAYLAWAPSRLDQCLTMQTDPSTVMPGIIIMPNQSYSKYMEEKRFDRYNKIHRPQEMGQHLNISMLFGVYEPGIRLPGFADNMGKSGEGLDLRLIREGTEEGLLALMDWMDDCQEKLLGQKEIRHTDLFVDEASMSYSLYTDQSYVVDRRPLYYGFVNVDFGCYATEEFNEELEQFL